MATIIAIHFYSKVVFNLPGGRNKEKKKRRGSVDYHWKIANKMFNFRSSPFINTLKHSKCKIRLGIGTVF